MKPCVCWSTSAASAITSSNQREGLLGGIAIHKTGTPFPGRDSEAGAGSRRDADGRGRLPEFDNAPPEKRPEKGLLGIRKALGVYANLRPVRTYKALIRIVASQERTGGRHGHDHRARADGRAVLRHSARHHRSRSRTSAAVNTMTYTRAEIERVTRMAFHLARNRRKKLTSVDKSNVLENSQLWRQVVIEIAPEFPDVELDHMLVDNCAMQLVLNPRAVRRAA